MSRNRNKSKPTGAVKAGSVALPRRNWRVVLAVGTAALLLGALLVPQFIAVARGTGDAKKSHPLSGPTRATGGATAPEVAPAPPPPGAAPDGMAWVPGGSFWMGDDAFPDAPVHRVGVDGFWMDKTEVTNAQFARFVHATGYVTVAEKTPDPKDFPGAPPEALKAGSIVFAPPAQAVDLRDHGQWWRYVAGADWRHPDGPGSSIEGRDSLPVVHVCYDDAAAYAKWAAKRLPTEAEWEFAARGGLDRKPYAWGDEQKPGGRWPANIWQGHFPNENTAEDGFPRAAPVGSFAPNAFGLFELSGNVWEWCADWYRPDYYGISPGRNPTGPAESFDPLEPGLPKRVQRGGSFLCSDTYCVRYKPGTRGKGEVTSGASHVGFRCVKDK